MFNEESFTCTIFSLPKILQVFEHDSETLLPAINELITKFDPDSPYWKVKFFFVSVFTFFKISYQFTQLVFLNNY